MSDLLLFLHFPAGVAARGIVHAGNYLMDKSEKLQTLRDKLYNWNAKHAIGIGLPLADLFFEYVPAYKTAKDGLVSNFTGGPSIPPNITDQMIDLGCFMAGYYATDVVIGAFRQSRSKMLPPPEARSQLEKMC